MIPVSRLWAYPYSIAFLAKCSGVDKHRLTQWIVADAPAEGLTDMPEDLRSVEDHLTKRARRKYTKGRISGFKAGSSHHRALTYLAHSLPADCRHKELVDALNHHAKDYRVLYKLLAAGLVLKTKDKQRGIPLYWWRISPTGLDVLAQLDDMLHSATENVENTGGDMLYPEDDVSDYNCEDWYDAAGD